MNLCITTTGIPGIRGCTEFGAHRVRCRDHEIYPEHTRPGTCTGCLPRLADRGHLCERCFERTLSAVAGWHEFRRAVTAAEGRLVSPDGVKGARPEGYSPLTLVFLTLDECDRHLQSREGRTVDLWVHDAAGARDAILFAHTAERAYRDLEIAERQQKPERWRCPACKQLGVGRNPADSVRNVTTVRCANCGHVVDEIRFRSERWAGSASCEHRLHAECVNVNCPCTCHSVGSKSRPGSAALWDADQHAVRSKRRFGRTVHTWREPRGGGEWATHRMRGDIGATRDIYRADWIIEDPLTITERRTA